MHPFPEFDGVFAIYNAVRGGWDIAVSRNVPPDSEVVHGNKGWGEREELIQLASERLRKRSQAAA